MRALKGFTLIELIVVMAIIAVLAAILVPSLIGYVNDARMSKANANAKSMYSAAAQYATMCDRDHAPTVASISAYELKEGEAFDYDGQTMGQFIGSIYGREGRGGYTSVKMEGFIPREARWADTTQSVYVGIYPGEAKMGEELEIA